LHDVGRVLGMKKTARVLSVLLGLAGAFGCPSKPPTVEDSDTSSGTTDTGESGSATAGAGCGDGVVEDDEACDDGNAVDGDGCESTCATTRAVRRIVAGGYCTCVVWEDGALRCWGSAEERCNGWGDAALFDLGDDETPASVGDVPSAVNVRGLDIGSHSCLVTADSEVRCWGRSDEFGQLGRGEPGGTPPTGVAEATPVTLGAEAVDVVVGGEHTCVRTTTGGVRCWGHNDGGQLGLGHTMNIGDDEDPASAAEVDLGGAAVQISAGTMHTCAVLDGGQVRCWGRGRFGDSPGGLLGRGDTLDIGDDELPASVDPVALPGPAARIVVRGGHTCALLRDGSLVCWGDNAYGQLGLGHTDNVGDDEVPDPAGIVGLSAPVVDLALYAHGTCVLLESEGVRCWGSGLAGVHGYGHTMDVGDDELPVELPAVDLGAGEFVELAAGGAHVCVRTAKGALRCWGFNGYGQLGLGHRMNIGDDETPASAGNVPYL
jgi:cysteine-rich repeat protein